MSGAVLAVEATSGLFILAEVNADRVGTLVAKDGSALRTLVAKKR